MKIYRGMDIGTAKPSLEQRAAVPHHMLDVVTPDVPYSAGRYAELSPEPSQGEACGALRLELSRPSLEQGLSQISVMIGFFGDGPCFVRLHSILGRRHRC